MKEQEVKVSTDLRKALALDLVVETKWKDLTPIARRDFISWVESAKQEETRKRRIERVGQMLKAGKRRPCCYAVVPMNFYKALGANPKAKAQWKTLDSVARRDLIDWVESAKASGEKKTRIEEVCAKLTKGK
jgi:uncharacterized protein YdeI (YjbR/CyaY-like superfamily)